MEQTNLTWAPLTEYRAAYHTALVFPHLPSSSQAHSGSLKELVGASSFVGYFVALLICMFVISFGASWGPCFRITPRFELRPVCSPGPRARRGRGRRGTGRRGTCVRVCVRVRVGGHRGQSCWPCADRALVVCRAVRVGADGVQARVLTVC